jgi:hypothetical protein
MTLEQMINMTGQRMSGFKLITDYLKTAENPIILETGSARVPDPRWGTVENNFKDDGMSTLIWDAFINEYDGEVHSVDIDPLNIEFANQYVTKAQLYCMDSIKFLWERNKELEKRGLYVDMLYLDSLHDPLHHLKELCTIMPRLSEGSLIVVDDNYGKPDDRGTLIHQLMDNLEIQLVHNGVQKVWIL